MYESILRFYFVFGFPSCFSCFFLFLNKTAIELKIKYDARQFLQRERQRERLSGRDGGKDGGERVVVIIQCCLPVQKSVRAPSAHCSQWRQRHGVRAGERGRATSAEAATAACATVRLVCLVAYEFIA